MRLSTQTALDVIPSVLQLHIILTIDLLKCSNLLGILGLNQIEKTPRTNTEDHARGLCTKPVPNMGQDEMAATEELLNVDRHC